MPMFYQTLWAKGQPARNWLWVMGHCLFRFHQPASVVLGPNNDGRTYAQQTLCWTCKQRKQALEQTTDQVAGFMMRAASTIAEYGLWDSGRDDGGVCCHPEVDAKGQMTGALVIRTFKTRWVFTDWPTAETYIEQIYELDQTGVTDASLMDVGQFELALKIKKGEM